MSEETVVAEVASSTPQPEASLEIPRSNTPEYAEWRKSGNLTKTEPVPADSTPANEDTDDVADSAAKDTQEKPSKRRPDVEERFKKLSDELKSVRTELEEARKPKTQADPSPAPSQPQTYQEWRKEFKAPKWIEDYAKANPEATYEDASAAMADHLGDMRDQFRMLETQRSAQAKELTDKVEAARSRYGDKFDDVLQPTANRINADADINVNVKAMIGDSEVIADLIFTLGSDPEYLSEFIKLAKSKPGQALRRIAVLENGIIEQLAKGKSEPRNDKGQFAAAEEVKPPAKRGPESAAAPPLEVGSRGAGSMDESERALQAIERGDGNAVRAFMQAENAKDLRRRRGV